MSQNILVSIDTEGPAGSNPVDRMIYGRLKDGREYGINYLMKLFDERNIRGLFFVDIPEIVDHGAEKIERVMKDIDTAGHDIGVHVHPDHMADPKRWYLWQYSAEEQYEIIARCTDFYEKVLGRHPVSFRAGRYGANNDTLDVLEKLGYKYDMSEFSASRYCKISPEVSWNRIARCGERELKEVPVTTFKSLSTPIYSRNDQIDAGNMPSEFRRNMKEIIDKGTVDVVSLFFHSFQFLDWRKNPDDPRFASTPWKKVHKNLDTLQGMDINFIKESDLDGIDINEKDPIGELDCSRFISSYYYFFLRAVRTIKQRIVLNV